MAMLSTTARPKGSSQDGSSERSSSARISGTSLALAEEVHGAATPELPDEALERREERMVVIAYARAAEGDLADEGEVRVETVALGARASIRIEVSWPFQGVIWATWPSSRAPRSRPSRSRRPAAAHHARVEAVVVDAVVDAHGERPAEPSFRRAAV